MSPIVIILLVIVLIEAYIIATTNKIDVFDLYRKVDKSFKEAEKIAENITDSYNQLADSSEAKDKTILTYMSVISELYQRLVVKNNCLIEIMSKLDTKKFKEIITPLEKENKAYQEGKKKLEGFLEKYKR